MLNHLQEATGATPIRFEPPGRFAAPRFRPSPASGTCASVKRSADEGIWKPA